MKIARLRQPAGLDRIEIADADRPADPGPGEIVVRVRASSLVRPWLPSMKRATSSRARTAWAMVSVATCLDWVKGQPVLHLDDSAWQIASAKDVVVAWPPRSGVT